MKMKPPAVVDVIMPLPLVPREAVEDRRLPVNPAEGTKIAAGSRRERLLGSSPFPHGAYGLEPETSPGLPRRTGRLPAIAVVAGILAARYPSSTLTPGLRTVR